jgi:radical SAM protein with 4Fe4S-binding SPASM domain
MSNFCNKPYQSLFLSPNGDIKFCCALKDRLGNINEESIDNILNNKLSNDIRNKIKNGEWHNMCEYCKNVEDRGGVSERNPNPTVFNDEKFHLKEIDLRWSNTCNLSCNYCNSLFSSKWAIINNEKINQNKEHSELSLINFVKENNETLSNVLLLGGEPLLQKQNIELLSNIADSHIQVLTNLSIDLRNNKIFEILKNKNNINWNISFETVKERFEYVRHGASWETFLNNLRTVSEITPKGLGAQPVYCVYSAFNLMEYYQFIEDEGYFNNVYWQNLTHPDVLDVFNLPRHLKEMAAKEIDECVKTFKGYDFSVLLSIKDSLMKSEEKDYRVKLMEYNNNLENKQLTNKAHSFNELYPIITQHLNLTSEK